jgi:hypothetical protein
MISSCDRHPNGLGPRWQSVTLILTVAVAAGCPESMVEWSNRPRRTAPVTVDAGLGAGSRPTTQTWGWPGLAPKGRVKRRRRPASSDHPKRNGPRLYRTAMGLMGDPVDPSMISGDATKRKSHLSFAAHASASLSKAPLSMIGNPMCAIAIQ